MEPGWRLLPCCFFGSLHFNDKGDLTCLLSHLAALEDGPLPPCGAPCLAGDSLVMQPQLLFAEMWDSAVPFVGRRYFKGE